MKRARDKGTKAGGAEGRVEVVPDALSRRKQAGAWLKERRSAAGFSQIELAAKLGLKYYTFISQVENGFGRLPIESMEAWALALGAEPAAFTRHLISFYEPELFRLLFGEKR
jgi:transcriptional regulator with XRE-family HTH domain